MHMRLQLSRIWDKDHVVEPFEIPKGWYKFRAADWGYSSPACVLWFAVDYNNNLWLYRELYTKKVTAISLQENKF